MFRCQRERERGRWAGLGTLWVLGFVAALLGPPARGETVLYGVAGSTNSAVAVGDGIIWWSSTIHQSWFPAEGADTSLTYLAACRITPGFVVTASDGSVWASIDGDGHVFMKRAVPTSTPLRALASLGTRLLAVGDGGAIYLSGDLNAASWSPESSPVTVDLHGVAWNGTTTVVVGDGGTLLRAAASASDFVQITLEETADLLAVTADPPPGVPGPFLAVGRDGVLWRGEPNGLIWTKLDSPISQDLYGAAWVGPSALVVGDAGTIYWSPGDFANWQQVVCPVQEDLAAIDFTGNSVLAVGRRGAVLYSLTGLEWRNTLTPVPVVEESWGRIKERFLPPR